MRHSLKVLGVDALAISAQVVKGKMIRNPAN
jgi:hypothetical protein